MALAPTPLASPNQRRSQYLAEALKSMRAEPERIGGYGDLAARLAAQYLTQRASEKTDEAVGVEARNAALARRQAMFGGIEGLDVGGEMQPVPSSRLGNPIAGALRMMGGGRQEQQAPSAPSRPAPEFNVVQGPAAPVGDVQGRPLPQIGMMPQDGGQDPRMGPVAPAPAQAAPVQADPNQMPPALLDQVRRYIELGTPEGEQEALKLVQGWQQRQAVLASLTPEQLSNPNFVYAALNAPSELGGSLAKGFAPMVGAAGSSIITPNTGQRYDVPNYEVVNDTVFRTTGSDIGVAATAPPGYDDVTGRIVAERPQPVGVSQGEQLVAFDPSTGQATSLIEREPADKPLSNSEQEAIENLEIDLEFGESALRNVRSVMANIDSGAFKLDPVSRGAYELRNSTGQSSPESLAYAGARTTVSNLRNTLLRENKGTQTEGDAIRILEEVIANWGDERVVRQGLAQFEQLYGSIQVQRRNQLDRRMSGASRQVGGGQSSQRRLSPEEASRLPPGTPFIGMDGVPRVRQ